MARSLASLALCAALLTASGCVGRTPVAPAPATPTGESAPARKLNPTTWIEAGRLLDLVVSTRVTRGRLSRSHLPLEVAVVNHGVPGLEITTEELRLVDADGREYAVAGRRELLREYGNVDVDARLAELDPILAGRYGSYRAVARGWTGGFDRPFEGRVALPRFSWAADLLYFERPEGDLDGRTFDLLLKDDAFEDAPLVRFTVQGRGRR